MEECRELLITAVCFSCTEFNGDCLAPKWWQVLGSKGKTNGEGVLWAECAISLGSQSLCQCYPHTLTRLGLRSCSRAAAGGGWALNQDNLSQRVSLLPKQGVRCAAKTWITSRGKHSWELVDRDEQLCGYGKCRGILLTFSLGLPICKTQFSCVGQQISRMLSVRVSQTCEKLLCHHFQSRWEWYLGLHSAFNSSFFKWKLLNFLIKAARSSLLFQSFTWCTWQIFFLSFMLPFVYIIWHHFS